MSSKQISIDLDVHKALESHRISFDETYNSILRRALRVDSFEPPARPQYRQRHSRKGGEYVLVVLWEKMPAQSLKEALARALRKIEKIQPGFLEKLSREKTSRGRQIVARTPEEIYPGRPQLVTYAQRLNDDWWFDTNISRRGCQRYLDIIGKIAGIDPPQLR